ncbi:MAG TPA: hypothetical protein VF173_34405 [Thermoanaerobaculia bacterium]|nr:hypothetical protein [Thermoanaerobaculia bacterium]
MTARSEPAGAAWVRRLFFVLALLYVIPFWTVRYLPTTDGPCHTYNAWVIRQYGNVEKYPLFHQYYEVKLLPYPNWTDHGVMALLMLAVPPLVAEKLLVSGYMLLFLGGAWYLAGSVRPGERWPAFLAFFFPYNQFFQFGFYNFSIGVALYLFAVGFWWRHRDQPNLRFAAKINLLLWLCWFSHVLSLILALLSIAVLWLATLRRESWRRHLLHVPILLPQIGLPLWFFRALGSDTVPVTKSYRDLLNFLVPPQVLFSFSEVQRTLAAAVAWGLLALTILTLWRETLRRREGKWPGPRPEDAFLLLVALAVCLYFFAPEGMSGGYLLTGRLSLFPYLLLIPWLAPRLGSRGRAAGITVLVVAALVNLGCLVVWYRVLGEEMRQFVAGLEPVRPSSRVLSLLFRRNTDALDVADVLSHATGYVALEKGLVDWDNYEATLPYFPIRFREGVQLPQLDGVALGPGSMRVRLNRLAIDSVYTWKMPANELLRQRLHRDYVKVGERYGGELFERRSYRQGARDGG